MSRLHKYEEYSLAVIDVSLDYKIDVIKGDKSNESADSLKPLRKALMS